MCFLSRTMPKETQDESRSISENSTWGIRRRFEQGKLHINHTKFLGYDQDKDGNLVINEKQAKIFSELEKRTYCVKFNLNGRLRGDAAARAAFYQTMRRNGIMSANDIRELEEMNLIPDELGGNKLLVNGNFIDMANAGAWTSKYGGGEKTT